MAERCPLELDAWDGSIPDVCRQQCEDIWDHAVATSTPDTDMFDQDCGHEIENGGTHLQRGERDKRFIGFLSICVKNGDEVFADNYPFRCSFNEV